MRTMSWSRYHTFTRIPTHLRSRAAKRLRRAARATTRASITQDSITQDPITQDSAARSEPERQSGDTPRRFTQGVLVGTCQSLTGIFRALRLRNRADI
jgi:hypothetical protein